MKNLSIQELISLKGKTVKFSHIDYDNGNVKNTIVVKDVIYNEHELRGKITFDTNKGEGIIPFYLYDKNGSVLAGDDADELEYEIIN